MKKPLYGNISGVNNLKSTISFNTFDEIEGSKKKAIFAKKLDTEIKIESLYRRKMELDIKQLKASMSKNMEKLSSSVGARSFN